MFFKTLNILTSVDGSCHGSNPSIYAWECMHLDLRVGEEAVLGGEGVRSTRPSTHHSRTLPNYAGTASVATATFPGVRVGRLELLSSTTESVARTAVPCVFCVFAG